MKILKQWGRLRYKHKVIIYVFLLITIAVLTFSIYTYSNYMTQLTDKKLKEAQTDVDTLKVAIDERLNNIRRYYISVASNDEVQTVIERKVDYSEYSEIKLAMDTLSGSNGLSDYITTFAFINIRTNLLLETKGMSEFDQMLNKDQVLDIYNSNQGFLNRIEWFYNDENPVEVTEPEFRRTINLSGLNYIMRLPILNPEQQCMVIANISKDTVWSWIEAELGENEELIVLNNLGELVFSSNQSLGTSIMNYYSSQNVNTAVDEKLEELTIDTGKKYLISDNKSNILNWTYYIALDIGEESSDEFMYLTTMLVLIGIMLVGFSLVIAYAIYTPINKLTKKAADRSPEMADKKVDELKLLESSLDLLAGNNEELTETVNMQRKQVVELFELKLLRGELTDSDIEDYAERYGIESSSRYSVVVFILRSNDENEAISSEKEAEIFGEIAYKFKNNMNQLLEPVYYAHALVCVICEEDKDVMLQLIMELFIAVKNYTESMYEILIGAGISAIHNQINELYQAYREGTQALNIEKTESEDSDTEYNTNPKNRSYCRYYTETTTTGRRKYDKTFENEITSAIMSCDKEQAYLTVNNFFAYIKQRNLSHDDASLYLNWFVNAIVSAFCDFGLEVDQILEESVQRVYMHIMQFYDLNECRKYIKSKIIDSAMSKQAVINSGRSGSVVDNVQKLINEHKGNITLSECAEMMHYHPTYIWKVLKQEKNRSFSDYLEDYKIEYAKKLLDETDMTVNDIAAEMNFTNAQNFIRFFNKIVGTTPGKYRSKSM